ncbi:MAG: glycosyltransferase [Caldilineaceae bacterium]|nr:glycosyltransferase [Caldilineaceae bacterium]
MKILFLTQVLPYPLDAGPKVRAYYVLRHLAQHHAVTLVSFVRPTDTTAAVAHLETYCAAVHTLRMPRSKMLDAVHLLWSLLAGQPFLMARDRSRAMVRLLTDLVGQIDFDAIHTDQLWMAPYALVAREAAERKRNHTRPLTVLDQHNAVYLIPTRLASHERNRLKRTLLGLEARKLARFELLTCRQFDHVTWVTPEDHAALQGWSTAEQGPVPKAAVIPICVNPQDQPALVRTAGGRRVTFLGGLHWPPNAEGIQWFVQAVWPQIHQQAPDALLTVIGKDPPPALRGETIPNLHVTGYVADPTPLLAETAVFIVPLHAGGGMRVKILDAWMWGLPVVSTTTGAEGIKLAPAANILIADSPAAFAQAVIALLHDAAQAEALGQAGRAWVERHYDWHTSYRAWDQLYTAQSLPATAPVAVTV